MKKTLLLLLVILTIGLCLIGCSKKDKITHISLYRACFNLEGGPDNDQARKVEAAINDYIKDKIGVEVEIHDIYTDDYPDQAYLALLNNEVNLLWTASWESNIGTNDLYYGQYAYDITDLLKDSLLYKSMDSGQWNVTKYDNRNYFIPVYKDNAEGYDLMFRQELIEKHGWNIAGIRSLEDIEDILADAKADGLKYPLLLQKSAMFYRFYIDKFDFFTADVRSNFVAIDRATDKVVNTIQTPEYLEYCKLIARWKEAGYISGDEAAKATTDTTAQTKEWAVSWWTDVPVNDEADARYNQDVSMKKITDRWAHSYSALGSCYCVTSNCSEEEAKACIDFLGLLYSDNYLADLYTFGIENEDFVYNEMHQVVQTSTKYNHSMWESASATVVTPLEKEPANKSDLYRVFNGSATTSQAAGFRFDRMPVENEYNSCCDLFNKYGYILECGGIPYDKVEATIAAYQAALDEAGYRKILDEFSKQYDEWKK